MSNKVHDIIKAERKKRGIPLMYWSKEMTHLAQSQANYCAKVGRMVHSKRYAFQGGENLCGGKGSFSPRQAVNTWLGSPQHRAYILSPMVTKSGIGIARRNGKMFIAWAFSSAPPTYPDCPHYKPSAKRKAVSIKLPDILKILMRRRFMRINPIKVGVSLVSGVVGFLGMALGAHGVYVYFNRLDLFLGGEGTKLFLVLDVPIRLREAVMWASIMGLKSWLIPVGIFVVGLWLFNFSRLWDMVSGFLDRIRP